jgi:hypothetical protein
VDCISKTAYLTSGKLYLQDCLQVLTSGKLYLQDGLPVLPSGKLYPHMWDSRCVESF